MTHTPDPAAGARVYELDRAHVFHSWSAQAQIKPMTIAGAEVIRTVATVASSMSPRS
jgi:hypothetical protein